MPICTYIDIYICVCVCIHIHTYYLSICQGVNSICFQIIGPMILIRQINQYKFQQKNMCTRNYRFVNYYFYLHQAMLQVFPLLGFPFQSSSPHLPPPLPLKGYPPSSLSGSLSFYRIGRIPSHWCQIRQSVLSYICAEKLWILLIESLLVFGKAQSYFQHPHCALTPDGSF